jgi:hypothetical protein
MTRRFRVAENKPGEEQVEDCTHHSVHDIQAVNTGTVNSYSVLLHKKYEFRIKLIKPIFIKPYVSSSERGKSIYTADGMKVGIEVWQALFIVSF